VKGDVTPDAPALLKSVLFFFVPCVPFRQVTGVLSELQAASQEKHLMTKALGDVKHSYFNNMESLASAIGHEVYRQDEYYIVYVCSTLTASMLWLLIRNTFTISLSDVNIFITAGLPPFLFVVQLWMEVLYPVFLPLLTCWLLLA